MRLVRNQSVRNRMMLPNVDRINDAIQEIVSGVTDELEAQLRTTFAFQARNVDLFYRRDSLREGGRFHEKFAFSRGLISQDANDIEVLTSPRRNGFLEGTVTSQFDLRDPALSGTVEDKDQFVVITGESLARGIITIQDFRLIRSYVQVTYDGGIAADRDKPDLFLQDATTFSMQGGPGLTFADANPDTITRDAGDWTADGFRVGDVIVVSGTVSNNGSFVLAGVATTVLTLSTGDVLVAEVAVSASVRVGAIQAVPGWLKELATLRVMQELTTSDAVAGALQREARTRSQGEAQRVERLERQIDVLLDRHTRYEPGAHQPVC